MFKVNNKDGRTGVYFEHISHLVLLFLLLNLNIQLPAGFILLHITLTIESRIIKSILCSQELCPNWICSKNGFFNSRCNNLEKWLAEREHSEKSVRKEILKARAFSRETLFDNDKLMQNDAVVAFNNKYYPIFKNIRNRAKSWETFGKYSKNWLKMAKAWKGSRCKLNFAKVWSGKQLCSMWSENASIWVI